MVFDSDAVLNALKGRTSLGCDNGPLSGLPPTLGRSNPLDDKDVQNRLICVRYPCAILARWHGSQPSVIGIDRRGSCQMADPRLMTVRNRICGQADDTTAEELATPRPQSGTGTGGGGGLSGLRRADSGRRSQDARHNVRSLSPDDVMPRHLQSGDHLASTAAGFAR